MPGVIPPVWIPDTFDYQNHVTGVPTMEGQRRWYQKVGEGFRNLTWFINYPELEAPGLVSGITNQGARVKLSNINVRLPTFCPMEVRQIPEQGDRKLGNKRIRGGNVVDKCIRQVSEAMRPVDKSFRRMYVPLSHKK